jgi:hypothetical protein
VEPAGVEYPWRQLGELLVDEGLLTEDELEQALLDQARTGRLLGQIVVANGYLSAFSLARVLSEQHGVQLRSTEKAGLAATLTFTLEDPPEFGLSPQQPVEQATWRPLGEVLLDQGILSPEQLSDALGEQNERHCPLGEILVSRELITGSQLAQALAEQHGVELDPADELEFKVMPVAEEQPMYKVFEVHFEPGFQRRTSLYESPNFLEAVDFAFEFVAEHDPTALEIHRTLGAAQETVWNYSASRAAATAVAQKSLVETFGFDPTKWGRDL